MYQAWFREFYFDSCTPTNCLGYYYQPQFKDEETKAQNGSMTFPRSPSKYLEEPGFLAPETIYCHTKNCYSYVKVRNKGSESLERTVILMGWKLEFKPKYTWFQIQGI